MNELRERVMRDTHQRRPEARDRKPAALLLYSGITGAPIGPTEAGLRKSVQTKRNKRVKVTLPPTPWDEEKKS